MTSGWERRKAAYKILLSEDFATGGWFDDLDTS